MWGGNLRKVALLGWLIEGVHSDVALKTLYLVAAAASRAAGVSEATVVWTVMAVSWGMAMTKAMAVSKAKAMEELKAAAATSAMAMATAICKGKSARVLVGRWLAASFDCHRGP
jgi:hypothetical protein